MSASVALILTLLGGTALSLPQCMDENNNPVDWYVLYKLPRIKSSDNSLIRRGEAYAYITSNNVSRGWVLSNISINDTRSMPGRTLHPLYDSSFSLKTNLLLWVLYNDKAPNETSNFELGHTKGVVMTEADGGLWLVHSVPNFPPRPDNVTFQDTTFNSHGYSYPHTGCHFGQSFLCISMTSSQMDLVGVQLMYNEPIIYSSNVPAGLESDFPHLAAAARSTRVTDAPWYHEQTITSLGGQTFNSFAKAGQFNKELYFDWVAPTLQINLLVETWRNGQGKLPSSCNGTFIVENISSVSLKAANVSFLTTDDHSKWAIADKDSNTSNDWVCIGDINRMESQEKRGGGTVCINHPKLWLAYRLGINSIDACPAHQ